MDMVQKVTVLEGEKRELEKQVKLIDRLQLFKLKPVGYVGLCCDVAVGHFSESKL